MKIELEKKRNLVSINILMRLAADCKIKMSKFDLYKKKAHYKEVRVKYLKLMALGLRLWLHAVAAFAAGLNLFYGLRLDCKHH